MILLGRDRAMTIVYTSLQSSSIRAFGCLDVLIDTLFTPFCT
jgi:hypothetical protein